MDPDDANAINALIDQMTATVWDGVPTTMEDLRDALAEADEIDAMLPDVPWMPMPRRDIGASIATMTTAHEPAHEYAPQDLPATIRPLTADDEQ